MINRASWSFFLEHAGYCTPPGRVACAAELARAEEHAWRAGWRVSWETDADSESCGDFDNPCGCYPGEDCHCEEAILWSAPPEDAWWADDRRTILAVLGGVCCPDDSYRRVVAAELALEAMS